jgi:YtcA family
MRMCINGHLRLCGIAIVLLPLASLLLAGCDPVVNIAGANFPAWLLCAIAGIALSAAFRPVFLASRIEPYLGPSMLIYPCLAILLGCAAYLTSFSRG